ncbi:carboxylesterase/lipase family protein [Mycobacterium vicinigordonae]|uniref:Carboxylic ester hydrolase n=1 Tax=Mycobacterium vicinigordonae TaxID=1719132 RepID=A0A7D6DXK2_9MYCO|nr:carboxylesterase/lipase family protein [Mycobacterium vicinigordonae]QLL07264.1 carboxylesterase/lipase family protein [Mycobacterium vicinigordonae]
MRDIASEVTIDSGTVRGQRYRDVSLWRSIPYAAAPVGALRFRAPQPVAPWTGVRDATQFGNAAHSHLFSSPLGLVKRQMQDEDCLTLNVCAPAGGGPPRPVLVFIHGGGFFEGSSALPVHNPEPLVHRFGVVLVTINYRLGGLGFVDFSQYSPDFHSNVGLRDQLSALQWVRRNIAAFGGDPDCVTVWGQSAGASAVLTHLAVPSAKGLFHRAIAQSPVPDAVRTPDQAAETARRVIEALGIDSDDAAAALRKAPAKAITGAAIRVMLRTGREVPCQMSLAPVIDGDLLPQDPTAAISAGRAHRVPLLIGTMRNEMGHAGWGPIRQFVDLFPTTPQRVDRMFSATDPNAKPAVLQYYPDYPRSSALTRLATDCFFVRPMIAAAEAHARHAPTYLYRLDYAPPLLRWIGMGAIHATDVPLVFGFGMQTVQPLAIGGRAEYRAMSDWVQRRWVEFARTGTPGWPVYADDEVAVVIDRPEPHVVNGLYSATWEAWRHYAGPQRGAKPTAAQ